MKKQIKTKILTIILLIFQLLQLTGNLIPVKASIKEGDTMLLQADHECDSLLEYWMEDEKRWSYKVVWYVYYHDAVENKNYPAFCVEPAKEGVGTGYDSYDVTIQKENNQKIWRILEKGYMGSTYQDWKLECDDDLYTATKVALHCLKDGSTPNTKYIIGNRSVDGNTVEEIQRRGKKTLEVAQKLYEYGINGKETYVAPKVTIQMQGEKKIETIQNVSYYVQNYIVQGNKTLKSYEVTLQNFPNGTKILNSKNKEQNSFTQNSFKIAIPTNKITQNIKGSIHIQNAEIKTCPIFYCKSSIEQAQSYVTYISGYEKTSTTTSLEVKANECSLEIQKIDAQTKKPISNVTFEIKDEKQNKIAEVTTNQNGIARLENLLPQTVTVKEIKVPQPYILSEQEKQVKLEWGKVANITFENERKKGNLKIVKVDAEDNQITLENVEFELYDSKGNLVKKLVTNSKGEAYVENLEIGNYVLKEVKNQNGYDLAEDRNIEIKWQQTRVETIENQKQKGQIAVYKIDQDNKAYKLEGVVFEVLDSNKKIVETLVTNKEGYAITSKLPVGTYYLKEIRTKHSYFLKQQLIQVEIKREEISTLQVENEKKKGRIEVYKVDKEKHEIKLENVEFQVLDNNNNIVDTLVTNQNGYAITKELPIGEYFVKEVKTNENYVLNPEPIKIKIEYGKVTKLQLENEKIKGQIKIVKTSEDDNLRNGKPKGSPIQDVVFEIRNELGDIVETITTNQEGIAISSQLPKGAYTIKEIKTNEDYLLTEEEFTIQILEHEKVEELSITNISKEPEKPKLPRTGF